MPSPPRSLVDAGCYHVIARGNNRQPVFVCDEAFTYFLNQLRALKAKYPAKLYHYCLMMNHIHLLIQIDTGLHLPKLMQNLLRSHALWFQRRIPHTGHLWQARFKSPLIADESYFLEVGRYIERNPVRAGIVRLPEEYPWSSYRRYALGMPNDLVDTDPYYDRIGSTPYRRRIAYRSFVHREGPYDEWLDRTLIEPRAATRADGDVRPTKPIFR